MSRKLKIISVLTALLLVVLSACNLNEPTASPEMVYTQAAETAVAAQLQTAMAVTPTLQASPTTGDNSTLEASNTPLITSTLTPGAATNTAIPLSTLRPTQSGVCDNALFVTDVTIPDYSFMAPGEVFVKTVRFKNLGPCTWTTSYHVVFSYVSDTGKNGVFTPPGPVAFPEEVPPGDMVDLSITMTAPTEPDGYNVVFRLQNDKGYFFGPEFWTVFTVR
jgi:hypothetical protein